MPSSEHDGFVREMNFQRTMELLEVLRKCGRPEDHRKLLRTGRSYEGVEWNGTNYEVVSGWCCPSDFHEDSRVPFNASNFFRFSQFLPVTLEKTVKDSLYEIRIATIKQNLLDAALSSVQ